MRSVTNVYDVANSKTAHYASSITQSLGAMVESSSYTGTLDVVPVIDAYHREVAVYGGESITFTGDVFVTEKEDLLDVLTDGDYYIDYESGYYKVIAATSATPTLSYDTLTYLISSVVDVELGAVELKNATTDDRATINAADTARTTGTTVLVTQEIDSTGKVSPAGDTVGNAPFVKVGDGTDTLNILVSHSELPTGTTGIAIFGRYETTATTYNEGDAVPIKVDANGRIVLDSDIEIGAVELKDGTTDTRSTINAANTARTTGTTVLAVQNIDPNGEVITLSLIETIESEIEILTGDTATLIGLSGILTGDTSTLIGLSGVLTGDTSTIISLNETLTGDTFTLIGLSETLTGDTATLIGLSGVLTGDTSTLISLSGDLTGDTSTLIGLSGVITGDTSTIISLLGSTTGDTTALISLTETLTGDTATLISLNETLTGDTSTIISLNGILTGDTSTLISLSGTLTGDTSTLIGLSGIITGDTLTLISLSETITGDTSTLISLSETLTGGTSTLISLSGMLTGDTSALISLSETITGTTTSIKTAVEIIDDWDENDRAKVNPIAGQIGIAGGTGVDGATVPRVTLATNVGLPAGTNSLGKVTITPSAQATRYATTAYAASGVIKGSAGSFYGLFGYNSKVSDQYLQLHDAASLPADTAVPVAVIKIPAESTFSIDCEVAGIAFTSGIVWCNSSTAPTKTIGSADVFLTALYL